MNTKTLFAGLLIAASSISASAQESITPDAGFVSSKTRAEVIAELQDARLQNTFAVSDLEFNYPNVMSVSTKTRAEVNAELQQARSDGTYDALHREYQNFATLPSRGVNTSSQLAGQNRAAEVN